MGSKSKYLIFIMIFISLVSGAQEKQDFPAVDTLTYKYYLSGEWDELIRSGEKAIRAGLDYKFLRQRLGYAWFIKGNYFRAKRNFEKALELDSFDQFSLEYAYHSFVNTGKSVFAGPLERNLEPALRKSLSLKDYDIVESLDLELNYKFSDSPIRADGFYYRFGIGTKLNPRISLYQSFSRYAQTINTDLSGAAAEFMVRQPEYYALVNWGVSGNILLKTSYHYFHSMTGYSLLSGNVFHIAIEPDLNRFIFEGSSSLTGTRKGRLYQAGFQTGYVFPGSLNFYIKESASWVIDRDGSEFIHNPRAGLQPLKNAWIEGSATIGKMSGYNDFNGLYVYNSYDPIRLRAGGSFFYYFRKNVLFWVNFTLEKKEYFEQNSYHYYHYSYLGGIRWKL